MYGLLLLHWVELLLRMSVLRSSKMTLIYDAFLKVLSHTANVLCSLPVTVSALNFFALQKSARDIEITMRCA
jgi:hypothetical protein